jgi:hypothetical protein
MLNTIRPLIQLLIICIFLYMSANILSEISACSVGSSLATLSVTVIICVVLSLLVGVLFVCPTINKYL